MKQGRKPGFKHSAETIEKIRQTRLGTSHSLGTKNKISESMSGRTKSIGHRERIAESRVDIERKCLKRYIALREEYPDQAEFFDTNKKALLAAMRDIKSEQELMDIRRYIETGSLYASIPYQYSSSSYFAAEDAMIALVDAASFLQRFHYYQK